MVTGVQTCALPIFALLRRLHRAQRAAVAHAILIPRAHEGLRAVLAWARCFAPIRSRPVARALRWRVDVAVFRHRKRAFRAHSWPVLGNAAAVAATQRPTVIAPAVVVVGVLPHVRCFRSRASARNLRLVASLTSRLHTGEHERVMPCVIGFRKACPQN